MIGKEYFLVGSDCSLMPTRRAQLPPEIKFISSAGK
jgi:hypothetical protein